MLTNKPRRNTRVTTKLNRETQDISVHLTSMPEMLPKQVKGLITNNRGTTTLSFRISKESAQSLANQLIYHYIELKTK